MEADKAEKSSPRKRWKPKKKDEAPKKSQREVMYGESESKAPEPKEKPSKTRHGLYDRAKKGD